MRRITAFVALIALMSAFAPAHAVTSDHRILISNLRYCPERPFPCDPADVGYVPGPDDAPAAPVYSPITTVSVKPGDTVTWVYDEPLCAQGIFCPIHTVTFADGSFDTPHISTQGATVTFEVPAGAKPGSVPYYCVEHVLLGMTGALQVG